MVEKYVNPRKKFVLMYFEPTWRNIGLGVFFKKF